MSFIPPDRPDFPRRPSHDPRAYQTGGAPRSRQLTRFRVVLVADPKQDLMHIVRSVMQLTRFPREEATHKMWEAHHGGRSVLLITYLERAELYAEQFAGHGLTVVVERA